jgi:MFS family permease
MRLFSQSDGSRIAAPGSANLWLYFACQALVASSSSLLVAESAIVGARLAGDPRLATLPVALQQLATLLTTFPASHLMARVGRRAGFSLGAVLGMAGGAVATLAILRGSFALFCAGTSLVGGYVGFATFYRFAAAESVAPELRGRALGWVMSAGVLAAFLGPWLARMTVDVWSTAFAGSYALLSGMALLALLFLQLLRAPAAQGAAAPGPAPDRTLSGRGSTAIAVAAGMVASAVMVYVMTATPLAMASCHHGFDRTAEVIQWHVLAMFAPSFVTGRLVTRFGAWQVVLAGLLLCAAAALVNASGTSVAHFQAGLVALGLGWNLAFIGVTTMLSHAPPEKRATLQGLNDLLVFSAIAVASLLAGVVEHIGGWRAVNLSVLPPVGAAALGIAVRLRARGPREVPVVQ